MRQAEKGIHHADDRLQKLRIPPTTVGEIERVPVSYPFPAIIGYTAAKRALLLLAVDRGLRGVLIAAKSGSDASMLARSFGAFISELDLNSTGSISDDLSDSRGRAGTVELTINITDDRLLGGIDLDRTVATGRPVVSRGVLARADGRILYVNDINLLEAGACGHLADAFDRRYISIEREGISARHEADFTLIGTFNSDEGDTNPLLRDRIGLIVDADTEFPGDDKVEIVNRNLRFDANPTAFSESFSRETSLLQREIGNSRARLPQVRITEHQFRQLSEVAVRLGVEGNRADVFAVKAARASAALAGRDIVIEDDLITAIQLVLVPRATSVPGPATEREERADASPTESDQQDLQTNGDYASDSAPDLIDDLILGALDARISGELPFAEHSAFRASRSGKRLKGLKSTRGRYVRSQMHRISDSRVAIDATLRAAAPFQRARLRKLREALTGEQKALRVGTRLRPRINIEPGDLRYKEFKHRSGMLFIFAIDASGSMALNRIAQAKGALTRLLQQAYLHRDQVALVSFRRETAEVLLTPTRSVEQAKRLTDAIPAGGGTPLAAGLAKALEVARSARLRGMPRAMIVLFTDGRANVQFSDRRTGPNAGTIADELRQLGIVLHREEIKIVVVDTKAKFVGGEEGKAIAELIGASHCSLTGSDARSVYDAITSAAERHRDD